MTRENTNKDVQPDWVYQPVTGWLYLAASVGLVFTPAFPANWLIGIYAAVATYQDRRRFNRPTFWWTFAVACLGAFAYIFYVHRRPSEPQSFEPQRSLVSSQSPPPTSAAADWYPDPHGRHRLRYWDGMRWTDHTAD